MIITQYMKDIKSAENFIRENKIKEYGIILLWDEPDA